MPFWLFCYSFLFCIICIFFSSSISIHFTLKCHCESYYQSPGQLLKLLWETCYEPTLQALLGMNAIPCMDWATWTTQAQGLQGDTHHRNVILTWYTLIPRHSSPTFIIIANIDANDNAFVRIKPCCCSLGIGELRLEMWDLKFLLCWYLCWYTSFCSIINSVITTVRWVAVHDIIG